MCICKIAKGSFGFLVSVSLSTWNNSAPTKWVFMKFDTDFIEKSVGKIKVLLNLIGITGTIHEDLCTFIIISRRILFGMKTIPTKSCREHQNTFCVK